MVTVLSTHCYITLNIMTYLILLHHRITIFHHQDSLSIIFINLITTNHRESLFFNLYPSLLIIPNQVIINHLTLVILSLNQNTIQLVTHNGHILSNQSLTNKSLVRFAYNPTALVLLYLVQRYVGKSTIHLNTIRVLCNNITAYVRLTSQTNLYPNLVSTNAVIVYLQRKLLTHHMNTHRVILNIVFNYPWVMVPYPPQQQSSLLMVTYYRILYMNSPQTRNHPNRTLFLMPLHLWIHQVQTSLLFHPNRRNGAGTWFHQIIQTKNAIISSYLPPLSQQNNTFHLIRSHPVDELVLQLLDVIMVLENV